jgi:hypothetical protein
MSAVPERLFPESHPVGTRRERRDRVTWLSRPTDVQAESPPLPCLVPKEGANIERKLQRGQTRN